jgi:hypothetical protein
VPISVRRSIDFDEMASHFGSHSLALKVENDQVGLLFRHMAVDAILRDGVTGFGECTKGPRDPPAIDRPMP